MVNRSTILVSLAYRTFVAAANTISNRPIVVSINKRRNIPPTLKATRMIRATNMREV
jgi:hypothetical protein